MNEQPLNELAAELAPAVIAWAGTPTHLTREQATRMVALFLLENSQAAQGRPVFDSLVQKVITVVNKHVEFGLSMTAGELKKRLEGVPDTTPVVYQRIEDVYFERYGWGATAIKLDWEANKLEGPEEFEAWPPEAKALTRLEQREDGFYAVQQTTYIPAFNAFADKDETGRSVFRIDAHY